MISKKQVKGRKTGARPRFREKDRELVFQILENWEVGNKKGHLTWDELAKSVGFSRGTLEARPEIKARYWKTKAALKAKNSPFTRPERAAKSGAEAFLQRIDLLEEELRALKDTLSAYDAKWKRYEFNAIRLGLEPEELDRPLPPLSRNRR
ncbi:hypothetical protein [Geothrix limicola]|uniref:hypothetical protein n=1 Tax=Geothrix limicola TaxID=2927978 RepID=UPI0025554721|nr:hypothetical protein [Geothrix limicola]